MAIKNINELLPIWDTAIVDLNRNAGLFKASNIRLRECSLHYSIEFDEYHIKYCGVTYGLHNIKLK